MSKYNFVLFQGECEGFVERLRELGLVDITTFGWEAQEDERLSLSEIEAITKAEQMLLGFSKSEEFKISAAQFKTGKEAWESCKAALGRKDFCEAEIIRLEKLSLDMKAWGEFSTSDIDRLREGGVEMRFFISSQGSFSEQLPVLSEVATVDVINTVDDNVYFVVIDSDVQDVDAQEVKSMSMTSSQALSLIEEYKTEIVSLEDNFSRCVASLGLIKQYKTELVSQIEVSQVRSTAQQAADGTLLVMEAWAESKTSNSVDYLLESYPNVVYFKSEPTPEDNTPVKLKNGWYSRIFEMIGDLYAVPKYGTVDLTPFFAPFYMLFFAICLCDAGYGAIIFAAGVGLLLKGGESMKQAGLLSTVCGASAVVFGFLSNSFFGMTIDSLPVFANFKFIDFQGSFFNVALYIGVAQIIFGMIINVIVTSRVYGFKYALGSLGWLMLLLGSVASYVLGEMGVSGFEFDSVAYYATAGVAAVLMLFFNSPDKNIFANFGAGIWDTYNNVTGLLGDVLSYIRLFAIGLSGGVLAQVFNSLALGMTGLDQGVAGQPIYAVVLQIIGATIILLLGHGINLFMSTISSFVHPMRLTFVEFYKNAGFEMGTRKFSPIKK